VDARTSVELVTEEALHEQQFLQVRSALGLVLGEIELESGPDWQVRRLGEGGALDLPQSRRPVRVRARGHLAAVADIQADELVLEPHTALRFTSFPLESVESWSPTASWESSRDLADAQLLTGRIGEASWGIAFDADRLRGLFSYLAIEFRFDDGTSVLVDHRLSAGRDDFVAWPWPPHDVARSDLRIAILGAGSLGGPFELQAHAAVDPVPETSSQLVVYDWGTIERVRHAEAWQIESSAPRFEFGPLVLGKDYIVTVRDVSSGAHVRRRLTHDGTLLELALADGLVVSGRVTFEPAVGLNALERATWSLGNSDFWRGEPRPIPLGPDGEFRFTLPDPVPWAERAPFPRPTALELELRMPGFRPHLHACDTAGIAQLDLGTVALVPRAIVARLANGHRLQARQLFDQALVLGIDGDFARELVVAGGLPFADGSLALTLDEESVPAELGRSEALLLGIDDALVPLARGLDGFQRVSVRSRVLRLESSERLSDLGERLELGLDWRGILYSCRSWPTRALAEPTEVELELPEDARVWWGLGHKPADRRTVALAEGVTLLRVP
jgi:hypothetical protein